MTKYFSFAVMLTAGSLILVSCGNDGGLIDLAGNTQGASGQGEGLFLKAKAADDSGKSKKAKKLYEEVADDYPMAPSAAQARYRQAEILEQSGEVLKSFDAYQEFLTRYQGSGLYSKALKRQEDMAHAAADGQVKSSFVLLKTKVSSERVVEMLGKVRDNAPRSATSAKAQYRIGEVYQSDDQPKEAINAYRKLVRDQPESDYAPEALFRVGMILVKEADSGNRNQATLELAGEAFNDYLIQYPGHSKNGEARRMLGSLESRNLDRSLEIAEFYDRTGQIESAKFYYRDVVKRTKLGSAHDKAKARLRELGE